MYIYIYKLHLEWFLYKQLKEAANGWSRRSRLRNDAITMQMSEKQSFW